MVLAQRLAATVAWQVGGPTASWEVDLRLIDPAPKQIRIEPVFQCNCRNRYADSLAGRYHLGLELLAIALPTTTL